MLKRSVRLGFLRVEGGQDLRLTAVLIVDTVRTQNMVKLCNPRISAVFGCKIHRCRICYGLSRHILEAQRDIDQLGVLPGVRSSARAGASRPSVRCSTTDPSRKLLPRREGLSPASRAAPTRRRSAALTFGALSSMAFIARIFGKYFYIHRAKSSAAERREK